MTRNDAVITCNGVVITQYVNITTIIHTTVTSSAVAQGYEVLAPTFRKSRLRDNDNITRCAEKVKPYLELSGGLEAGGGDYLSPQRRRAR
jgi:hypothetical protein